jgi:DUF1365 family protein
MRSCLYVGEVRHARLEPFVHRFRYRLFLACLDLGELDRVFRGRWLWGVERRAVAAFRRADHLGDPARPLEEAVRERVEAETGVRPSGPIALLTQLRLFGFVFNPVSFYFCYDAAGERVEAIVAEVTNTPWNERHCYVLRRGAPELGFRTRKEFHVSPFLGMELEYAWRFSEPGERLEIAISDLEDGRPVFHAELSLARREITGRSLARTLARQPFATAKLFAAIYWQALRLALRGAPFHPHPQRRAATPEATPR